MKNYQKSFGALLLAGIVSMSAGTQDASAKFYVGASAGWNQSVDKATLSDTNRVGLVTLTPYKINSGSAIGQLFAGYEKRLERIILGGEVFLVWDTLNIRTYLPSVGVTDTLKKPFGFGGALLLGAPLTEQMDIFAKFKVVNKSFEHKITTPEQELLSTKKTRFGMGPEVEVKFKLTENVKLHASTYYLFYNKSDTGSVTSTHSQSFIITSRPSEYGLLLGVSYSI